MNKAADANASNGRMKKAIEAVGGRRIAATATATLAALLLVFTAYQAYAYWQYERGRDVMRQTAQSLAEQINGRLGEQQRALQTIAGDPRIAATPGSRSPGRTLDVIRGEHAGLDRLLLLPPGVEYLTPAPYPDADFAAIAVAIRAKSTEGAAGPMVSGVTSGARTTWAITVGEGSSLGEPAGILVASWRLDDLVPDLEALAGGGYLDIRYTRQSGAFDVIDYAGHLGSGSGIIQSVAARRPLAVGFLMPRPFLGVVRTPVGIFALLLVVLGLAVTAWTLRHGTDWIIALVHRREDDEQPDAADEPVLSELVDRELEEAMDFAEEIREAGSRPSAANVQRIIFRAYDIRGVVGKTLTRDVANLVGRAIGSEARARGIGEVVVGRDGRLSSPEIAEALIGGLTGAGVDVTDIGAVPTGVLYFATHHLGTGSGVMVTGSHNPPDYNGFKIMLGEETLATDAIADLYRRIVEDDLEEGAGGVQEVDILEEYVERIASDIQVEEPLKVVIDCGNGIPGVIAPQVLEEIGCEVVPLYCDVDGNFPNHHPDPSEPDNLRDLIVSVKKLEADIGLAFDGDGDRLGVVTRAGQIIYPDRILMLFAEDVLLRNPGATVIYDVKCTGHLAKVILGNGGSPLMWKTGHSLMKSKMRETDAALAGEMSGHFFFKERWYGFDDGIYAAARLLEILASSPDGVDGTLDALPDSVSTPELKIPMKEGEHFDFMREFSASCDFPEARITTIDGIRADYDDGWGLVRCSNTTPCLVLRFDAESDAALTRIQEAFKAELQKVRSDLDIPF